jgi:hypothetical protein
MCILSLLFRLFYPYYITLNLNITRKDHPYALIIFTSIWYVKKYWFAILHTLSFDHSRLVRSIIMFECIWRLWFLWSVKKQLVALRQVIGQWCTRIERIDDQDDLSAQNLNILCTEIIGPHYRTLDRADVIKLLYKDSFNVSRVCYAIHLNIHYKTIIQYYNVAITKATTDRVMLSSYLDNWTNLSLDELLISWPEISALWEQWLLKSQQNIREFNANLPTLRDCINLDRVSQLQSNQERVAHYVLHREELAPMVVSD